VTGDPRTELTPEALERVAAAVARAEAGTAGEIVVMLCARSGLYRSAVLVAALVAALLLPWPLILLTHWSAAAIALAQAGLATLILVAGLHEGARLALVPRGARRTRVRAAALCAFRARGLDRTRGRTGLLLYIALAEHHAEIVADRGILDRIAPESWESILSDLAGALGRGEAEAGLIQAVGRIGERLMTALPAGPADPDELPNRVILTD
jgi:putative membrane protein